MTLNNHLGKFYKENNIPIDGGVNDKSFNLRVFGINLKLPNPRFRSNSFKFLQNLIFIFWAIISQIVILVPILIIILVIVFAS
jgi:hypothetical protein